MGCWLASSARARRLAAALAGVLLASALATGSAAELAQWDQKRVTAIAGELAAAVNKAAVEVDKSKGSRVDVGKERTFYELREDIRLAKNTARHLAKELEAGKGRDETYPTFRRLSTLRNDAAESARRAVMPDTTVGALTAAGELMLRLRPYYEAEPTAPAAD
jgi:predicted membrane metal-binding protein